MPKSETNWEKLKKQSDTDISDAVASDSDTFLPDEAFWEKAIVKKPNKEQITIRIDTDVLRFFKGGSPKDYQKRINSVLRTFMEQASHF